MLPRLRDTGHPGTFYKHTSKGLKTPTFMLTQRLHLKIGQVLHQVTDFTALWTSNLGELARRHEKIRLKISGYFRTLATTTAFCQIQSYLATT